MSSLVLKSSQSGVFVTSQWKMEIGELRFLNCPDSPRMGFAHKVQIKQFPALVKAGCREAAGRFVQENQFPDQHHPGASRHPSSAEEWNIGRYRVFLCKADLMRFSGSKITTRSTKVLCRLCFCLCVSCGYFPCPERQIGGASQLARIRV